MSDDGAGRFDPRFDPAFQRGFAEGSAAPGAPGAPAPAERPSAHDARRTRVADVADAAHAASARGADPRGDAGAPTSLPLAPDAGEAPRPATGWTLHEDWSLDAAAHELEARRPRPALGWLVAIGLVGVGLILTGVGLLAWLRDQFSPQASANLDYGSFQAAATGAPLSIALGAATLVALLFALAYRRR